MQACLAAPGVPLLNCAGLHTKHRVIRANVCRCDTHLFTGLMTSFLLPLRPPWLLTPSPPSLALTRGSPPADELLAKKSHREWLQSYEQRKDAAVSFMLAVRPTLSVAAGALRDPKEPTQAELDPDMQALVVSKETLPGGDAINVGRVARRFAPLRLVVVSMVRERADGSKLSSTELREQDALARK